MRAGFVAGNGAQGPVVKNHKGRYPFFLSQFQT